MFKRDRCYPVKVDGNDLVLYLSAPPPEVLIEKALTNLQEGFPRHEYDRMAREIARLQQADSDHEHCQEVAGYQDLEGASRAGVPELVAEHHSDECIVVPLETLRLPVGEAVSEDAAQA